VGLGETEVGDGEGVREDAASVGRSSVDTVHDEKRTIEASRKAVRPAPRAEGRTPQA
jgi:hypothetical protein